MATRVQNIITASRSTLGDPNGDRWDNARLVNLVDEGQLYICRHAGVLRENVFIQLEAQRVEYELPAEAIEVTRAVLGGKQIPLYDMDYLEAIHGSWENESGKKLKAIVYDRYNQRKFRTWPIVTEINSNYNYDSDAGVITDIAIGDSNIEYIFSDYLGIVTELEIQDSAVFVTDADGIKNSLGVNTNISEFDDTILRLYYTRRAETIAEDTDTIEINEMWDAALKMYVVGKALMDDNDAGNVSKGNMLLGEFVTEVAAAQRLSQKNFTRNSQQETIYRRV